MSMFSFLRKPKKEEVWIYSMPKWHEDDHYCQLPVDILEETNTLIAGICGAGKSVLIHNIMYTAISKGSPFANSENGIQFVLADPKMTELDMYRHLPHVLRYSDDPEGILDDMDYLIDVMMDRYQYMKDNGLRKWTLGQIYFIVDELADLMCYDKKGFSAKFTKIMQLSRAAGIHVIACTQSPAKLTIPASAQLNYTCRIGLRCSSSVESKQIIGIGKAECLQRTGMSGCQDLPQHGKCIYVGKMHNLEIMDVPMIDMDIIERKIEEAENGLRIEERTAR